MQVDGYPDGNFIGPTIITNAKPHMKVKALSPLPSLPTIDAPFVLFFIFSFFSALFFL